MEIPFIVGMCSLLVFVGSVLGCLAFVKVRRLESRVEQLRQQLAADWESRRAEAAGQGVVQKPTESEASPASVPTATERAKTVSEPSAAARARSISSESPPPNVAYREPVSNGVSPLEHFTRHLQEHWMIWLGGICVGLSGIFMVRYSIEAGWLGPKMRIALALVSGLSLHGAAEWLRRRAGANPAFAALAGGASITLYAALLAAMQLYQLIAPGTVFVLLAMVSLFTMVLAIQHGPVLAILGILGAYIVPILVSTGSGNVAAALVYALIITGSALWLMQRVYRSWLWLGALAGALGWWALSLTSGSADGLRGPYLAVLAYILLAVPERDWSLSKPAAMQKWRAFASPEGLKKWLISQQVSDGPVALGLLFIVAAQALSLVVAFEGASSATALSDALRIGLPLTLILLISARKSPTLAALPWLALLSQLAAWVVIAISQTGSQPPWPLRFADINQLAFIQYAVVMAVVHFLFAAWHLRRKPQSGLWASLMLLSPLLWLAAAYALTDAIAVTWQWSALAVVFGIIYLTVAGNRLKAVGNAAQEAGQQDQLTIWLLLAGHMAYSLAVVFVLREATLTLALAAQAVSLAWVIRRFGALELGWLLKLALAAVVIRLTFNPWLMSYPTDVHWSLYTYGGATLLCAVAAWLLRSQPSLRSWLEAVTLHLLVLTLWAEARYWLYGGDIFRSEYGFIEATINANAWGALALVYYWRSRVSTHLQRFYQLAGNVLLVLALANYGLLVTVLNPLFGADSIGFPLDGSQPGIVSGRPILNLLLLAYGLPILLGIVAYLKPKATPTFKRFAAIFTGFAAFVFVNLEIRHLWHAGLNTGDVTKDGELYTYSVVWLIIAVAILLLGSNWRSLTIYRVGLGILATVIAKLFLFDMAGLEGMLRVASFMGLGLSLLGLGYLLQRSNLKKDASG